MSEEKLNTYHAFYKGKKIELQAKSSYAAQQKAALQFKARKEYQVTVVLVALSDEEEIVHIATD